MDLRIQKTYQALFGALRVLMVEKPFEKITVTELCKKARTRTATFYTHFSDKYELFAVMVAEERRSLLEEQEEYGWTNLADYIEFLIRTTIKQLKDNRDFILAVEDNPILQTIMQSTANSLKEDMMTRLPHFSHSFPHQPELVIEFINGAISRSLFWWMQSDRTLTEEELVAELKGLVMQTLTNEK